MKHPDQVIDAYSRLKKVEMPPDKYIEVRKRIKNAMESELRDGLYQDVRPIQSRKRPRWGKWIPGAAASIAGICVVLLFAFVVIGQHNPLSNTLGGNSKAQTSQQSPVKPSEVASILDKSEAQLDAVNGVVTTASSFDGKDNIKFRLMVNGTPSQKEATKLFNDILTVIKANADNKDIWSYYNGQFDIKNYTTGVVYTATKTAGQPLVVHTNGHASG
ncbi:anti-sigma factor [Alicyclobacillus mengziensis]|uniref:Anti-sigma factor n=1 Tax=Alicyclobacillus mengziensis TaxID=2931921 RepID=A0A9X7Z8Y3_9BACL|nr:anti-sigma factor [Alicyclobacillus mengziensis]QSO48751.1 anti-sigma factor [Alicyclobacillus mengziensis]